MLNRQHRFHGYGSLKRVYSNSKGVRGQSIGLRYSRRGPNKKYRVAVVVPKKVNKSAVARNRIRRRIFEIIRLSEVIPPSADLIFTVYSDEVREAKADDLSKLINGLIQRISL
jgi:ribonuclease P protein component